MAKKLSAKSLAMQPKYRTRVVQDKRRKHDEENAKVQTRDLV